MVEKYIVIKIVTQLGASKDNFMEDCPSYTIIYFTIKRIEILRNQNTLKYNIVVDKMIK
jgi:hypothetical protein